jgi:RimJ/RimL family protein N-acetyltransferase
MRWVHASLEACPVIEVVTARLRIHPTLDGEALLLLELLRDDRVSSCFLDPPDPDESEAAVELVQRDFTWAQKGWLQVTAVSRIEASPTSHVIGGARIFGAEISYYIGPHLWRQGF